MAAVAAGCVEIRPLGAHDATHGATCATQEVHELGWISRAKAQWMSVRPVSLTQLAASIHGSCVKLFLRRGAPNSTSTMPL